MKKTRLLLLTMLLTFIGALEVSAQEAYCALDKEVANNGNLQKVIATFYYDNLRDSRGETVDVVGYYPIILHFSIDYKTDT